MDGTILGKKYNLMNGNGGGGASSANIAPTFSEESQYIYGDLVFHEGQLYRFEVEEHEPGPWNPEEVMGTSINENLVMLPGDGIKRTMHEFSVKLKSDGGLHFDQNGAIYADHLPDYRLTEHDTKQQWIDGRPIYAKTEMHEIPSTVAAGITRFSGTSFSTDLNVIKAEVMIELQSGLLTPGEYTPWYIQGTVLYAGLDAAGLGVYFGGDLYSSCKVYVTLYYTKSTQTSKKKTSK